LRRQPGALSLRASEYFLLGARSAYRDSVSANASDSLGELPQQFDVRGGVLGHGSLPFGFCWALSPVMGGGLYRKKKTGRPLTADRERADGFCFGLALRRPELLDDGRRFRPAASPLKKEVFRHSISEAGAFGIRSPDAAVGIRRNQRVNRFPSG